MAEISDDDLLNLDEFALLPENAEQIGHTGPLPRSPVSNPVTSAR